MNYHLQLMVKKVLGTDIAERNFAIFPDDTFLVSYPDPAIPGLDS